MKLRVDHQADALYLRLDESGIVDSQEVAPGIVLDFNVEHLVVGVEILHLSRRAPGLDPAQLVYETAPITPALQAAEPPP